MSDTAALARVVREDIIPLLEKYSYEDYEMLERVLGTGLVDVTGQRIRQELFVAGKEDDLIKALLQPTHDLSTAVLAGEGDTDNEGDGDDEGDGIGTEATA